MARLQAASGNKQSAAGNSQHDHAVKRHRENSTAQLAAVCVALSLQVAQTHASSLPKPYLMRQP
jgi:hypothetical protein